MECTNRLGIEEYTCPICYQECQGNSGIAKAPSCGHIFCTPCILTWAGIRPFCPLCKVSFDFLLVGEKTQVEDIFVASDTNAATSSVNHNDNSRRDGMTWEPKSLQVLFEEYSCRLAPLSTEQDNGVGGATSFSASVVRSWLDEESLERGSWWNGEDDWLNCELDQLEEDIDQELWEEEAMLWSKTSKQMQRQCGNRPFGASGYIKNERLRARASASSSERGTSQGTTRHTSRWRHKKKAS
jgi:hypothetical protein